MASSFFKQLGYFNPTRVNSRTEQIYNQIVELVQSGKFATYSRVLEQVPLTLAGNSDKDIASIMGLSETSVRISRQRMSRELYDLLGTDVFDILERQDPSELALLQNRLDNIKFVGTSDTLDPYVLAKLRELTKDLDYDSNLPIRDYLDEIEFVIQHSRNYIDSSISKLNPRVLKYLLDMLDGKVGHVDDRIGIHSKIAKFKV